MSAATISKVMKFSQSHALMATACAIAALVFLKRAGIKKWLFMQFIKRVLPFETPPKPFKDMPPPPAPDYAKDEWWAGYPGKPSHAESTPDGQPSVPDTERPAAAFFVHPTGYFSAEHWNEPRPSPPSEAPSDRLTDGMMQSEASAFNGTCRIYAPHYRQATIASYFFDQESGREALELAYSDVKQAFLHFLQQEPTAPLVLASHSQGGHHLMRLLGECIEPNATLQGRLVAVYLIGSTLPSDMFARCFPSLHPSNGPIDTPGAVIAWDTKAEPMARKPFVPAEAFLEFPGLYYHPTGWESQKSTMLNTNPLTWKSRVGERVTEGWLGGATLSLPDHIKPITLREFFEPPEETLKANIEDMQWMLPKEGHRPTEPQFFAETLDHCLCVPHLKAEDRGQHAEMSKDGDYHVLDYAMFYYNIRKNVAERVEAFCSK